MKIIDFKQQFVEQLQPFYDSEEVQALFHICLDQIEQKTRLDLIMQPELESSAPGDWKWVITQLKAEHPIQYLFAKTSFYGNEFYLDQNVLIPRPETEELIEWILATLPDAEAPVTILDIGTGSGCIAISLAKALPNARVYALDVSEKALRVAGVNVQKNGVKVQLLQQDVLALEALEPEFDLIVSNPPYVRHLEKAEMKPNVLDHEPHLALFVEDHDPLLFYKKIAQLAATGLKPGGHLFFEINQYLGAETLALVQNEVFEQAVLRPDLMQNDRMIHAVKK